MTLWESVQKNMTWRGVIFAGIAAGTAFLIAWFLLAQPVLEVDPTLLLNYVASLFLGSGVLDDDGIGVLIAGVVVHYALSLVFALIVAIVIHRWGLWVGLIGGGLLGVALYGINLFTLTVAFEWFFALESTLLLGCHILFGAVAGAVYEMFDHYDEGLIIEEDAHGA
jgi:hypothetical protein